MGAHVFVDETKERGYFVAAAAIMSTDVTAARQAMRRLVLPGQRRIHFHKEKDERRSAILAVVCGLGPQVVIYDAAALSESKIARDACLTALVTDLAKMSADRVVIERDDSTLRPDQQLLYRQVRVEGVADTLRYDHMRAHEECLLAIPDAVAWCWARGGHWRAGVRSIVPEVRYV